MTEPLFLTYVFLCLLFKLFFVLHWVSALKSANFLKILLYTVISSFLALFWPILLVAISLFGTMTMGIVILEFALEVLNDS